jgi:hypothetical protein
MFGLYLAKLHKERDSVGAATTTKKSYGPALLHE